MEGGGVIHNVFGRKKKVYKEVSRQEKGLDYLGRNLKEMVALY